MSADVIGQLFRREAWVERAACRGMVETAGPSAQQRTFFPERGGSTKTGRAICADCPVRQECAEFAIPQRGLHGIWGGMSQKERSAERRRRAAETAEGAA